MDIKKEPEDITDSVTEYDVQWQKYKEEIENNTIHIKTEKFDRENGSLEEKPTCENDIKPSAGCSYNLPDATPSIELQIDEVNIKKELSDIEDMTVDSSDIWIPKAVAVIKFKRIPLFRRYFVCYACFDIFPTTPERESHENLHQKSISHTVSVDYGHAFENGQPSQTKTQKVRQSGDKPHKCDQCKYSCIRLTNLKQHRLIHSGEKPYACDQCDYCSVNSSTLKKHKLVHVEDKPYKCDECEYSCILLSYLKCHKMKHAGDKPFKCEACNYSAIRSSDLKKHRVIHSEEKPFKCGDCNYSSTYSWHMKTHKMIHSGIKPFKCNICPFECRRKNDLKLHKMFHSGEKHLKCDKCDYSCMASRSMKRHRQVHSVEISAEKK